MWIEWSMPQHHFFLFVLTKINELMHLCVATVVSESCTVVVFSLLTFLGWFTDLPWHGAAG